MARILIADDDPGILNILSSLLKTEKHEVTTAGASDIALEKIKASPYDLIISDLKIEPFDGLRLLKEIRQVSPRSEVIIITGHATVESALEAMRLNVYDFIIKPFKIPVFLTTVNQALENQRADSTGLRKVVDFKCRFEGVVAESASMKQLCDQIAWVAPTETPVLLLGEEGSQLETLTRIIHDQRGDPQASFMVLDASAVAPDQIILELFGRDADGPESYPKPGLLEQANHGTFFVHHINRLNLEIQAHLLNVITTRTVARAGQKEAQTVKIRWMASSSVSLEPLISQDRFQEELYRKFSSVVLRVAPLRNRLEDIIPLAYQTIRYEFGLDADLITVDPDAQFVLEHYAWPGNQTELEEVILHAMKRSKGQRISKECLPGHMIASVQSRAKESHAMKPSGSSRWAHLRLYLNSAGKEYIHSVHQKMGGDNQKTARALKMPLQELLKRLAD